MLKDLPELPHGALASGTPVEVRPSQQSLRAARSMLGGLLAHSKDAAERVVTLAEKLDLLQRADSEQVEAVKKVARRPGASNLGV